MVDERTFQPYRTLIERIPFFPCVGNHDTGETLGEGGQGDTLTLYDNLLVTARFQAARPAGTRPSPRACSIDSALAATSSSSGSTRRRISCCLVVGCSRKTPGKRGCGTRSGRPSVRRRGGSRSHTIRPTAPVLNMATPTACATRSSHAAWSTVCTRFISGHEHNFQSIEQRRRRSSGSLSVVTGGGGQWRSRRKPEQSTNGFVHSWGERPGDPLPDCHRRSIVDDHRADHRQRYSRCHSSIARGARFPDRLSFGL